MSKNVLHSLKILIQIMKKTLKKRKVIPNDLLFTSKF